MRLATTTLDFAKYTCCQTEALDHIRKAGFRYADYSFGKDYDHRSGIYSGDDGYFDRVAQAADDLALQDAAERYLYELGRTILQRYDCFAE